jgi:hypothetical protein
MGVGHKYMGRSVRRGGAGRREEGREREWGGVEEGGKYQQIEREGER